MIKQTLFFSTPVCLSLKNCQLVISWKDCDDVVTRPIEDLGCVVLENPMINITMPLLCELVKNNVSVILCDAKQMPTALLQPLEANATQSETLKFQMAVSEPAKKQAWKQIIEAKIRNQSAVLSEWNVNGDLLRPHFMNVKSGDTDNREGLAARIYWTQLFGCAFRRERDGAPPNALLNYGYTILRAATTRALMGSGLFPNIGIFHKSRYNAFPLADDVMEPYRPYVDDIVRALYEKGVLELDKNSKRDLFHVLSCDVHIGKVVRPLQIALTITTASLARYFSGETKNLILPVFKA